MSNQKNIKNNLTEMKETLNSHLEKFNSLKNEKKYSEAWKQLLVTLKYANSTLDYAKNILEETGKKLKPKPSGPLKKNNSRIHNMESSENSFTEASKDLNKKMIVIPRVTTIH